LSNAPTGASNPTASYDDMAPAMATPPTTAVALTMLKNASTGASNLTAPCHDAINMTLQHPIDSNDSTMLCEPVHDPSKNQFDALHITVETVTGNKMDAVALVEEYIYGLTCCFDMGWQQRASGRNYNSQSGHAFLVGANSNKILMRVCYSKGCCTCTRQSTKKKNNGEAVSKEKESLGERRNDDKGHRCPHNFDGSSKSMEAIAAVKCITALYETKKARCKELVSDDNSSTRANCRHSFKAKIVEKIWHDKETCWPRKNGKYLLDHGKLPLHVPEIERFLADPAHRCKCVGKELFKLAEERGKELSFDKIDCARLKRNFSYWLRQNCNEPFEIFEQRFPCIVEHHFGRHEYCVGRDEGGWCKYKGNPALILKAKQEHRYHDKDKEPALYMALMNIMKRFSTKEMLMQLWHPHWIQKNESLNQLVSILAPKDKHLSSSMSLSDRVALVVIVDSVGFAQGLSKVFKKIVCSLPASTLECLKRQDAHREYDKKYHQNIDNKCRHGAAKQEVIKASLCHKKANAETGINYEPCMAIEEPMVEEELAVEKTVEVTKRAKKAPVICPSPLCITATGGKGHKTPVSKKCIHNPNHPNYIPLPPR